MIVYIEIDKSEIFNLLIIISPNSPFNLDLRHLNYDVSNILYAFFLYL